MRVSFFMVLKIGQDYFGFELKKIIEVKEQNGSLLFFKHKKTKAKVLYLKNNDDNLTFGIAFKTPPFDDGGEAHILEHSVLCGSKKYPLKDPFSEILKSSITTFLNAFTYPDKTIYPISTNNKKEFDKLIDIYLDAVFYPNLLNEKKIFLQEGWRYELKSADDEIRYNGVVYSEMKGVFSSPINILERKTSQVLFPDNLYRFESGGDPKEIVKLSYEDLKNFHKNYYHPTNSYIYFYGNLDIIEKLEYLNKEYLSKFENNEKIIKKTEIQLHSTFEKEKNLIFLILFLLL